MEEQILDQEISITKAAHSRVKEVDFETISLGKTFTDHMFICDYRDGQWVRPRIEPMAEMGMHPATMALHYGQAVFEGMKTVISKKTGHPMLFRPERNAERLNLSAERMGIPALPKEIFMKGLNLLVNLEKAWIPKQDGSALYLRPFIFADEAFISIRAANSYRFIIIATPAGPFFRKRIKLLAETKYIRAADGGTGEAKAAGNYAAAILPTEMAKKNGFDQVLWLDAKDFNYIQEVGTMNIFFRVNDTILTPKPDGSILKGITRDSVITLLKDHGFEVMERKISIEELKEWHKNGELKEAFGTGTAVSIARIESITHGDDVIDFPEKDTVAQEVLKKLDGIKTEEITDTFDWVVPA